MKKLLLLLSVFILFSGFNSLMAQTAHKDLQWAKSLMDRGDYSYAIEKFEDIVRTHQYSEASKREATYYIGYCYVKNNDPWQAIRVFERFLEKYAEGYSKDFVPDSLYVLGRLYEETGDKRQAIKVYRRCSRAFPGSSFARKSADRLRQLEGSNSGSGTDPFNGDYSGGDNYDDSYNDDYNGGHGNYPAGISREIRQLLRIAKTVNNSFTRDQMLIEGADRARTGEDFIALANAINNDFTRGQLVEKVKSNKNYERFTTASMLEIAKLIINNSYMRDQFLVDFATHLAGRDYVSNFEFVEISEAMNNDAFRQQMFDAVSSSPAFKVMSARTVVDLAKTCRNSYIRDQLLLKAAQNNYYSYRDIRVLAEACSNAFIKTQIMQASGSGSNYDHYRNRNTSAPIEELTNAAVKTDPFEGFAFNKAQLKRVNAFVKAIESKKNVKQAVSRLNKSDLSLTTVRENMEKFRAMQKFENLHR